MITIKSIEDGDVIFYSSGAGEDLKLEQDFFNEYVGSIIAGNGCSGIEFADKKVVTPKQSEALSREGRKAEDYSEERKNNATWTESKDEIHESLIGAEGEQWKNASLAEKKSLHDFTTTAGCNMINEALYDGDYKSGACDEKVKIEVDAMTSYLNRTSLPHDAWLERGIGRGYAGSLLGVSDDLITRVFSGEEGALDELRMCIGDAVTQDGFLSSSPQKGASYAPIKNVVINMYVPEGSHVSYAEPYSKYGNGPKMSWDERTDGTDYHPAAFGEFETIVQRGAQFTPTKIEFDGQKLYIDGDIYTPDI